ncbi:MaoC family dehydratase N-terminal domain-containing protein [Methylobacterium sp. J-026]|uniref:MaoC/PaaZ C-terminal domain-containing protein n=1 Tax=Methylobacterium sp. J-026 TaxID=2836624 RepID=UPI001FB961A4|nr:MaoC/PaaZ C-terminal domain-containing protein [Methylobacterium sp. J-026]MCJ2132486.1 MaoC family dehydratase N-terminal domain-containing protein [Methylobacterium sp. J-026]
MPDPALEDFTVGDVIVGAPLVVTRDAIVDFARQFDFQPFHLDAAAAEATFAGRLIGSGWHTAALGMRMLQQGPFRGGSSLGAPGIDELRWLVPVLPGDALTLTFRVVGIRDSASKPGLGFVTAEVALDNPGGETVLTQRFTFMLARRGNDPLPPRPVETGVPGPVAEPEDAEILPFLRDAALGAVRDLGPYPFSAEAIVAFARAYDPQAFHLDPEAARRSHFGGLCASGWHTAAAYMNRLLTTRARDAAYTATRGPVPEAGPSPGFKNLRWLKPVYVGDIVRFSARLTDKRASASRPGWGLAFARNTGVNQRGEPVFSFDSAVFHRWEP